ncbi:hypothetical protein GCM10011492_18420 [Flexivirga endophytica]|uniref:Uncharacterized protein n=1 Tax=Flexivirga endophytica TaxID=1849103 RepID=A0A916WTA9_9MICO|nr:hypothetical protein [Flexivirga endophytica]GGB28493.1 hypothetical protein GCM10011492_18420 [Flexivirga endophytica]GHB62198.1 hypothetical protein GCM10008112_34110 [Flexivirga endophytica]
MIRRLLLVLLAVCAAVLLPWTTYLGRTLPASHQADGWRVAWVGFDIALMLLLACALWLGRRRHRMATSVMTATAALLGCDAWFDIVLDWGAPDDWASIAMACVVEIPLAVVLLVSGRQLLSGGMARHTLTAEDVRLQRRPSTAQILEALEDGPATVEAIIELTGLQPSVVEETLRGLRRSRHVRRSRGGRWVAVPISLQRPAAESLSPEDRQTVEAFYDGKILQETELFEWAAAQHSEFADWVKGSRSRMLLTERELIRFDREYLDLVMRYAQLHAAPTGQTRELAVRWYAFPTREDHERVLAAGADR